MSDVLGHSEPDAEGARVALAWHRFNDRVDNRPKEAIDFEVRLSGHAVGGL